MEKYDFIMKVIERIDYASPDIDDFSPLGVSLKQILEKSLTVGEIRAELDKLRKAYAPEKR